MCIRDSNNIALSIISGGNVGIKTTSGAYPLDVNGTVNALLYSGSGASLNNVNISDRSTSLLTEGSNLYYTTIRANADFDTRLATKTTSQLVEGSNLYYTTDRANVDFDNRLATTKTTSELKEGSNLYYTTARGNYDFDTRLATTKTTSELKEGSNLYYLTSRVNTCLLYTSPSPRDRTRSRMPSSA